jgi:hypothetical protein
LNFDVLAKTCSFDPLESESRAFVYFDWLIDLEIDFFYVFSLGFGFVNDFESQLEIPCEYQFVSHFEEIVMLEEIGFVEL